ncbi:DUF1329 domain-containing protein [Litoribrevibacter euphylliae]|uniref:DUF1329 domain-containing protein n=1 Tax=Litoribrevibacter euphylliae TaxID=1834034 RepID=A0ABV7HG15_9GAMM
MKLQKSAIIALKITSFSLAVSLAHANDPGLLGTTLTPIGAEKSGNAEGTIPEWSGGLPQKDRVNGKYPNPFKDDNILFAIDAKNLDQHASQLSEGMAAMLKRYPTLKLNVYPTNRSASYSQLVYERAKANATTTKLVDEGNGIEDYQTTVPFPFPKSGVELVWNHVTRYRGQSMKREVAQFSPLSNGTYNPIIMEDDMMFVDDPSTNSLFFYKQTILSPARLAGNVLLIQETINQVLEPRRAWLYNAGQRRVRRAPQVVYDSPGNGSDGQRTTDNYDMFNGSPDQYEWTLKGKKEMYIPYNAYKLNEDGAKYAQLIQAGHLNPDYLRYELHRVYEVEATLKSGKRNIYSKRTLYFDEDTYQIAYADMYDSQGNLWRVGEGHTMNFYDHQINWYAVEAIYDLSNGRYYAFGLFSENEGYEFNIKTSEKEYTPNAIRRSGVR